MPHSYRQITEQDLKGGNAQSLTVDQHFVNEIKNEVLKGINAKSAIDDAPPAFTFSEDKSFFIPELIYSFDQSKNIVGYKQIIPCKMTCPLEMKTDETAPKEADATLTIELVPVYSGGKIIGTERIVTFELNEQVLEQHPALEMILPSTNLQLELDRIKQRAKQTEIEQKQAEIIAFNAKRLEKFTPAANKIAEELTEVAAIIEAYQTKQWQQLLKMALLLPEESDLFTTLQAQWKALQDLRDELTKFEAGKKRFFTPNYVAWLQAYQKKTKQLLAVIQESCAKIGEMISAFSASDSLAGLATDAKANFPPLPHILLPTLFSSSDTTIPKRLRKLYSSLQAPAQNLLTMEVGPHLDRLRELDIAHSLWPNGENEPNFYQANCFHDVLAAFKIWQQQGRLTFKMVLDFYRKYYAGLKTEYRKQLNAWLQQSEVLPEQNKQPIWDVVADRVWWQTNDGTDFARSNFEETFLVFKTRTDVSKQEQPLINWYQQCYADCNTLQKNQVDKWRKTILPETTARKLGDVARNVKPSSLRIAENWQRMPTSEKALLVTVGILGSFVLGIGAISVYLYLNRRRENENSIYPNQFEREKRVRPAASTQKLEPSSWLREFATASFLSAKKSAGRPSTQIMQKLRSDPKQATSQTITNGKTAISDDKEAHGKAEPKSASALSSPSKKASTPFESWENVADFANNNSYGRIFESDTGLQEQTLHLALLLRENLRHHLSTEAIIKNEELLNNIAKLLELILCQTIAPLKDRALLARAFLKDILPSQCRSLDLTPLFQQIFASTLGWFVTHPQIIRIKTTPNFTTKDIGKLFLDMAFLPEWIFDTATKIRRSIKDYEKSLRPWWPTKKKKIKNEIAKVFASIIKNQRFPICPIFAGQRFIENVLPTPIYTSLTEIFSVEELFAATVAQLAEPSEISPGACLSKALEFFRNLFAIEANQEHVLNAAVQDFYEKGLNLIGPDAARTVLRNELRDVAQTFLNKEFVEVPTINYAGNIQGWNGDGPIEPPVKTPGKRPVVLVPTPVQLDLPPVKVSPVSAVSATKIPTQSGSDDPTVYSSVVAVL